MIDSNSMYISSSPYSTIHSTIDMTIYSTIYINNNIINYLFNLFYLFLCLIRFTHASSESSREHSEKRFCKVGMGVEPHEKILGTFLPTLYKMWTPDGHGHPPRFSPTLRMTTSKKNYPIFPNERGIILQ